MVQRRTFNKQLEISLEIAILAHKGKIDKAGKAYIAHPLAVRDIVVRESGLTGEELIIAECSALLHDVLEGSQLDSIYIRVRGIDTKILNIIHILTRLDNEDYETYINRVVASNNKIAMLVKIADLTHNMDLSRYGDNLTNKAKHRREKYEYARNKIIEAIKGL